MKLFFKNKLIYNCYINFKQLINEIKKSGEIKISPYLAKFYTFFSSILFINNLIGVFFTI